ncbi:hypothetical protein BJ508DRAFT_417938 [Ascobolus immersus RN42]|uniref:Uncharacterized protein n=1 Tax=Ascobolus immersus RN42 TaxID=1160509 RepID=A0A3N4HQ59_ASCIM|nr:hypothetical protein BJ508DRAFT_417938 [Ascobolus immersus RN42]
MPITFRVATHDASKVKAYGTYADAKKLYTALNNEYQDTHKLWLCSLDSYRGPIPDSSNNSSFPISKIAPQVKSGLVQTIFSAYSDHHHLILRPDDLWISIISQFALYLENTEHSEALRKWFTDSAPGEKKEIVVEVNHLSEMPRAFRAKLDEVVLDKQLIPWITPDFTTTTEQDREVASYLLMCSLKNYFTYRSTQMCGIPSVTLLGEKRDYEEILRRIDFIDKFGQEDLSRWAKLLRAVLQKAFIDAFDMEDEESKAKVVDTWSKVAHHRRGSGMSSISGWVTAFTFFGKKGTSVMKPSRSRRSRGPFGGEDDDLAAGLLGTGDQFGEVDTKFIAPGVSEVEIEVHLLSKKNPVKMKAIAGVVGIGRAALVGSEDEAGIKLSTDSADDDTVFPVSAWWLVEQDPKD